ncbi:MAG: aldo/keto reductase [Candidatus Kariarchaeaceae archaeon]|jgi:aryl-alcohol dehydrogenase-like predicted oxidoreductase
MRRKKLRGSNKEVSALGMGCFALGGPFRRSDGSYLAYGHVDKDEAIKTIHKAIELGINLFDTADIYGVGRSERILGEAIKEYQDDMIIATKFASVFEEGNVDTPDKKNTDPEYIRSALDASMRRLQTDFIDIYQLHSSSQDPENAKKVQLVLEDLVQEGRIGGYGWSTDDPERMKIFTESLHCNSVQYALLLTHYNADMLRLCEEKKILGLIRSPLASGTLTGKYKPEVARSDDHMLSNLDLTTERRVSIQSKLEILREISADEGRTLVQGILGWLLATSNTTVPIPGAKSVQQIEENARTLEFGPLSSEHVQQVNDLFEDYLPNDLQLI